jgi:threonine dehydratase
VKVERTRGFGAEVILHGDTLRDAYEFTLALAKKRHLELIHPYDDESIMAGQGTIAVEMLEAVPALEVIVVPVGGGGLIAGNAVAAKAIKPDICIVGVESQRFPSMRQAMEGVPIRCGKSTMAEGIAVQDPGQLTLPIIRELVDEMLVVSENQIEAAVLLLLEVEKTVVEGAGAVGLAAVLGNRKRFRKKKVGLILSGGNIDLLTLSSIIQRGLVRSGRLVRLRLGIPDVPGALANVTKVLADNNANIVDLRHQRAFSALTLRSAEVEFVLQTLGKDHVAQIVQALAETGLETCLPDLDACGDACLVSDG